MYTYVSGTWLIANFIHPFMLLVVFGWDGTFDMNMFGFGLQFLVFSILFSTPSLLFSNLAMHVITRLPFTSAGKYFTWLITAPALVFINYWLIMVLFFD